MNFGEKALELHKLYQGKFCTESKVSINSKEDLSTYYTPGVAVPCLEIKEDRDKVYDYTSKGSTIAVISDGTAVLGLGNIGAEAAIPVMEGKAILFKKFGEVDAVPICLDSDDTETIIQTVKLLAPSFGGINLEDISSPRCFEIEKRLEAELDIPIFHDDQHGTAIVVLAGLINATKLVKKELSQLRVVLNGPGAAGTAIVNLLLTLGMTDIIVCDENGILTKEATKEVHKKELAEKTNPRKIQGDLANAIKETDVFIGVSVPDILTEKMIHSMNSNPIVFAMANPNPEISYKNAKKYGVKVMGTGRSDAPNQINNLLAFPGIFKGALNIRATSITPEMKIAAAYVIANVIKEEELTPEYIIPDAFDTRVATATSEAVMKAWKRV